MKTVTAYFLRHQHHGFDHESGSARPHTPEETAAFKAKFDKLHGREGWVKEAPAPLQVPDEVAAAFEPAPLPPPPVDQSPPGELPKVKIVAHGTVTPPDPSAGQGG